MTRTSRFALIVIGVIALVAAVIAMVVCMPSKASWAGVDEVVIEQFARIAGREPKPLFDMDSGDLLLFLFLIAGTVGGFVGGYCFRGLFPPKHRPESE